MGKRKAVNQQNVEVVADAAASVLDWNWPPLPQTFAIKDEYSNREATFIDVAAHEWTIPWQGRQSTFSMPSGRDGFVIRSLIVHTQVDRAPSSIYKFTRNILLQWEGIKDILQSGWEHLPDAWDDVLDLEFARAAKIVLKYVCDHSLGGWKPHHRNMVNGLNSRAADKIRAQQARLENREFVLPIELQDTIVSGIDRLVENLPDTEAETDALVCLISFYQHGVRPGELFALRTSQVKCFFDSQGNPVCHLWMRRGKQRNGSKASKRLKLRAIRRGWAAPFHRMMEFALAQGRSRFLLSSEWSGLTTRFLRLCRKIGATGDFTTKHFRHTLAQYLTDMGHDAAVVAKILGQEKEGSVFSYTRASMATAELLSAALGESVVYRGVEGIAYGRFASLEEIAAADEDEQIGAVVGATFITGIGLCGRGQNNCKFNPVTSCYGCDKYVPGLDVQMHRAAVGAMKEEVVNFYQWGKSTNGKAFLELRRSIEVANGIIGRIEGLSSGSSDRKQ